MKVFAERKQQWRHRFCIVAAMLLLPSCSCSEDIPDIDPVSMAQDVRVNIGGQSFILPRVSFHRPWRDSERGYLETPPFDGFTVWIGVYGSTGELLKSREICPLLTRQWSRSICESAYTPLYLSLPREITLLKPEALTVYRHTGLAGAGQTKYDVVSKIRFDRDRADRACSDPDPSGHRFCSAGIRLGNGLIALWDGNPNDPDDDARVGQIVRSFVKKAIGPRENFEALDREAVLLRDPRAPCTGYQPYDRKTMERVRDYAGLKPCPPGS